MEMLQRYLEFINQNHLFSPKDRLLLAVSGGVDSVVLCELCSQAGFSFGIAHCNFQLRGEESERDEKFVATLAEKYNVTLHRARFDTLAVAAERKVSTQEAARMLRYHWFEQVRTSNNYNFILTAHHGDDNIETVLMNFFRGTGIRGVRGIEAKHGFLVRPLLFARRRQLEDFLVQNGLQFVSDHTNEEDKYTRNFFRHHVIPAVEEIYPGTQDNIMSNIERFREAVALYEQAIGIHKERLLHYIGNEVHIPVLKLKSRQPLHTIVYELMKDYGFTAHQTADVVALLDSDTGKFVSSATHRVIRNRKWLIIAPLQPNEAATVLIEPGTTTVEVAAVSLHFSIEEPTQKVPASASIAFVDASAIKYPLILRRWRQGDYFYPLGLPKKKKLARFFIDQKLSKTQKENVWVLESDKKIIWVIGYRIDDRFKLVDKTRSVLKITCRYRPN